jgi:hypothetical protein
VCEVAECDGIRILREFKRPDRSLHKKLQFDNVFTRAGGYRFPENDDIKSEKGAVGGGKRKEE